MEDVAKYIQAVRRKIVQMKLNAQIVNKTTNFLKIQGCFLKKRREILELEHK